jgi:hypothetical protein
MPQCEVCGNDYDKTMEITRGGETHVFDSAPACDHCGCRIIGHGIEANGSIFCCAHCATREGVQGARDRVGA